MNPSSIKPVWRKATSGALAVVLLLLGATSAEAHSDLRVGAFAVGILHPLQTPAHLLVLVAVGLLLARRPPFRLAPLLGVFAPCAAAGLLLTLSDHAASVPPLFTAALALGLGVLLASGWTTSSRMELTILVLSALVLGLDSGYPHPTALIVTKVLFGNGVSLLVIVGYVMFYASLLPACPWTKAAFRIAGSWIVAISLLLVVFSL